MALGESPRRAVMRHAIGQVVKQDMYWQDRGRYLGIRWLSNKRPVSPARDCILRTSGFLSLMHLVVLESGPDPISPHLIRYVLEGPESLTRVDEPFLRVIDPAVVDALQLWKQFDTSSPLPQHALDPLFQTLAAFDIDVCVLSVLLLILLIFALVSLSAHSIRAFCADS